MTHNNVFKIIFINRIAAKRAFFPVMLLFKIEVLQHTRPTVDMSTLGYPGTNHFFQRFHTNRTPNIFWICHIHLHLHDVKPIELFIGVHQINEVTIITSVNFVAVLVVFVIVFIVLLVLVQWTSSVLVWILKNEFHCCLHEFFFVKVALISFAVTVSLGVFVTSWRRSRNTFYFFFFNETKLNLHGFYLVFIVPLIVVFLFCIHANLILCIQTINFLKIGFAFILIICRYELFRIGVELLAPTRWVRIARWCELVVKFVLHLGKIEFYKIN